jgi:hypothetical protein
MESLNDMLPELTENYGLKIYAISVDDSRTMNKVKPYVSGKGWELEVLLDVNGDFKRGMNVNLVPHYFIFDASDHLVCQKSGFSPGDEDQILELLENLKNGDINDN